MYPIAIHTWASCLMSHFPDVAGASQSEEDRVAFAQKTPGGKPNAFEKGATIHCDTYVLDSMYTF
ncbi:uncharacterized protein PHALS_15005 [Plasmopara halstedii]|uniref:Uncharacterized protein n=1 Tax=Plasmopara halstedii TaxID=4781 RepID=A0A0P1B215_PLAHL|nr:uncharacterized protein PHALS_15005 [Plasmopara halstedii]CEG47469.1 hypothetical protein PHALS_15005 [Plasmopara halstedii]|eukprot:XP_024583838.1 hypothetical protein PHALS_15005 [Plasmopara halstedii]